VSTVVQVINGLSKRANVQLAPSAFSGSGDNSVVQMSVQTNYFASATHASSQLGTLCSIGVSNSDGTTVNVSNLAGSCPIQVTTYLSLSDANGATSFTCNYYNESQNRYVIYNLSIFLSNKKKLFDSFVTIGAALNATLSGSTWTIICCSNHLTIFSISSNTSNTNNVLVYLQGILF
jgi:hypothetical protein